MRAIFATALLAIGALADNSKSVDFGAIEMNGVNYGTVTFDYNWVKSGG